jgi:AcrR family transcriptional regulator
MYNRCDIFPSMPKVVDVEQRRAEITDAAARLIARSGLDAVTMRDVAAEAGWTTGVVTHYFADKHELLLTTFRASLERRRARRPEPSADPHRRLVAMLDGVLPLDDDRRRHWMVTIACCSQAVGDEEIAAAQRDAYRQFVADVAELVVAAGIASSRRSTATAAELIAVADGIAVQALFDPEGWPPHRQRAMLSSLLADRIAPTP